MIGFLAVVIIGMFFLVFCAFMLSPAPQKNNGTKSVGNIFYVSVNQDAKTPEQVTGDPDSYSETPHIMQADLDYVDINTSLVNFRVHFVRKTVRNHAADLLRLGKVGIIITDILHHIVEAPGFPVLQGDFLGGPEKYDIYLIQGSERFDSSFELDDDTGDIILQSSGKSLYGYTQSVSSSNSIGESFVVVNVFETTYNEPESNSFFDISDTEAADFALTLFHELTHAFHFSVDGRYAPLASQEGLATVSELVFTSWTRNHMSLSGVLAEMQYGVSGKGRTFDVFGTAAVEHLLSGARPRNYDESQVFAKNVSYEFFLALLGAMCFMDNVKVTKTSSASVFLQIIASLMKNNSAVLPSAAATLNRQKTTKLSNSNVVSGKLSYSTLQAMRMLNKKFVSTQSQDTGAPLETVLEKDVLRTAEQKKFYRLPF